MLDPGLSAKRIQYSNVRRLDLAYSRLRLGKIKLSEIDGANSLSSLAPMLSEPLSLVISMCLRHLFLLFLVRYMVLKNNSVDELKILNIYERIFLRKAKFMFNISKSVNQMFPFRHFNETLQSLRSTGALDVYTPRPQKEIFKQGLIDSGSVIWNNLPVCLKNLETVDSFHRHCIKRMKSSLSFNL